VQGDVRDRQVEEVDHVDVEVEQEPVGRRAQPRQGLLGRLFGAATDLFGRQPGEVPADEHVVLGTRVVGVAEQQQPVVAEQGPGRAETGQLGGGPGLVEQVGHAHGVDDAGRVGGRGEQVHAAVHVEQGRLDAAVPERGHHRDGDAAFAAQHQRDPSVGEDLARPPPGLAEHADHGPEVVGPALDRVGPPAHHRQVAVVHDVPPGRGQPLGQSGPAQGGRGPLLARPVRGRAGGDTEQAELTHHRRLQPCRGVADPGSGRWPRRRPRAPAGCRQARSTRNHETGRPRRGRSPRQRCLD
jgi:hypothetical protein